MDTIDTFYIRGMNDACAGKPRASSLELFLAATEHTADPARISLLRRVYDQGHEIGRLILGRAGR